MVRRKKSVVTTMKTEGSSPQPTVTDVKVEPENLDEGMESNGHQGEAKIQRAFAAIFIPESELGDFVMKEEPQSPQTPQLSRSSRPRRKSQQPMGEEAGSSGIGLRRSGRKRKLVVPFELSTELSPRSSSRPVKKQTEPWRPTQDEFISWLSQEDLGDNVKLLGSTGDDNSTAEMQGESSWEVPAKKKRREGQDLETEEEKEFRGEVLRKLHFLSVEKGLEYIDKELGWKLEEVTGWKGKLFMKQKMRQVQELQRHNKYEEGLYICNDVLSKLTVDLHYEVLFCKATCLKKIGQISEAFSLWEDMYRRNEEKYGADCGHYTLTVYQEMCMAAALLDTQGNSEPWKKCMTLLTEMVDPELNQNTIRMSLFQIVKKLIKNENKNKAHEIYDFIFNNLIQSNKFDFKILIEKSNCLFEFGKHDEAYDILMALKMDEIEYTMANCAAFAEMFHVACKLRKYGRPEALEKWSEFMKQQAVDPDTDQMVTLTIASDVKKQNGTTHKHDNVLMFDMVASSVGETIAKTDPKTLQNIRNLLQS